MEGAESGICCFCWTPPSHLFPALGLPPPIQLRPQSSHSLLLPPTACPHHWLTEPGIDGGLCWQSCGTVASCSSARQPFHDSRNVHCCQPCRSTAQFWIGSGCKFMRASVDLKYRSAALCVLWSEEFTEGGLGIPHSTQLSHFHAIPLWCVNREQSRMGEGERKEG